MIGATCQGGLLVNNSFDLTDWASGTPALRLKLLDGHADSVLRISLRDADGTSFSWDVPLEGLANNQTVTVHAVGATSLTAPTLIADAVKQYRWAEAGADIVGVSATLETAGSDVEREVTALGRSFRGFACDFSDRGNLYDFVKQVKADGPQIDILVNNAGTILRAPAAEHPDEYWDKIIEVNLNAQFVLSREFGKDMVLRGSGKTIFTASLLTFQGGIIVTVDGGWMGR